MILLAWGNKIEDQIRKKKVWHIYRSYEKKLNWFSWAYICLYPQVEPAVGAALLAWNAVASELDGDIRAVV